MIWVKMRLFRRVRIVMLLMALSCCWFLLVVLIHDEIATSDFFTRVDLFSEDVQPLAVSTLQTMKLSTQSSTSRRKTTELKKLYKQILIYSYGEWEHLKKKTLSTHMDRCRIKSCTLTYNKSSLKTADAVIFRHDEITSSIKSLMPDRRKEQIWVLYVLESPENEELKDSEGGHFENVFHWLMSYKYTSDVLTAYGHYTSLEARDVRPPENTNFASGKSKTAIWIASNCVSWRQEFVRRLRRYVSISIGGGCAWNFEGSSSDKSFEETSNECTLRGPKCDAYIQKHKFTLAFENSFCEYYVTEKYWVLGIGLGLIPVVLGATYTPANVIPGSYIDASSFPSIKALGEYLNYLDKNDTAYNRYFAWKQKYKSIGHEKICRLCAALHDVEGIVPTYKRIWRPEDDCRKFDVKKNYINELVEDDKKIMINKI